MKGLFKHDGHKGDINMYYVAVGAVIAIGVVVAFEYFKDRRNDVTIHVPKVEAH